MDVHAETYTTTTTTKVTVKPYFDPSYVKTIPGIVKIIRMVCDLIGFICIMCATFSTSQGNWFCFVSMTGLWVTAILLAFYLCHIIERTYFLPWMLIELAFCTVWTVLYIIAASLAASWAPYFGFAAYGAAAFFGFASMLAYGFDAFLKFRGWRMGEVAQGSTTTNIASPTAY